MNDAQTRIAVNKETPGCWRVTLDHPPINTVDDRMYDEIYDLVERIEAEASLKVVTFESANPEFFLAHYGIPESSTRFAKPRWIETPTRLAMTKTLTIATILARPAGV